MIVVLARFEFFNITLNCVVFLIDVNEVEDISRTEEIVFVEPLIILNEFRRYPIITERKNVEIITVNSV